MASFRIACSLIFLAVAGTVHAQHFPPLDVDNPPKSRTGVGYSFCMTARKAIPTNSSQPLFTFDFAAPSASGVVLIDGKTVKTFRDEQHLLVYTHVLAGDHRFILRLDKPAANTLMSSNDDFKYCQPK
jgi:hypothetical protein